MNPVQNQSVGRVFAVVEYLAAHDNSAPLATIARDLNMNHTTVYRFLASLRELGYVKQSGQNGPYKLTMKFGWISSRIIDTFDIRGVARPYMEELTRRWSETSHLGILEGDAAVYIEKIAAQSGLEMRSRVGSRLPLHATAIGKALLANLDIASREERIADLHYVKLTPNTLMGADSLREDLKLTTRRGYALDNEENESGIRCVAAPIFDHTGSVTAAMSIAGWTRTMTVERLPEIGIALAETAGMISEELGFISPVPTVKLNR